VTAGKETERVAQWWGTSLPDDERMPEALRPASLEEFRGQPAVTRELGIIIGSAKARHVLCDHLLLTGPPGLGKTTLASIVASELGLTMVSTSGPAISKPGDLAGILTGLRANSLLFIDEIHALPKDCEEILYTPMEDQRLDIVVGEGISARSVAVALDQFVLVGATTQAGRVSAPLRDRFGYKSRLRLYEIDDLTGIVARSGRLLGFDETTLTGEAARAIASRSRGTPRVANWWLKRVRDYALLEGCLVVDEEVATSALEAFGVDSLGLDELGRDILRTLCENFMGGPAGLGALASAVGESPATLEEVYEPYLVSQKLYARTPRGRVALPGAWAHLGLEVPARFQLEAGSDGTPPALFE
jgi:holliday junction DNA helicase RuvB